MKKLVLIVLAVGFGNLLFAQDLANCKKTCTEDVLVERGAFLGVRIVEGSFDKHAKIVEVLPNTAAERNHFVVGDVITNVNGVTVQNRNHLVDIIKSYQPRDIVKITYLHADRTKKKRVELGALFSKVFQKVICCDEPAASTPPSDKSIAQGDVQYTLYPNPAVNSLRINSDQVINGLVEINIVDMLGNQVISKKVTVHEGLLNQKINLSSIASGSYMVKITNEEAASVVKLIVTK